MNPKQPLAQDDASRRAAAVRHFEDRLQGIAAALAARQDALALLALGSAGRETARVDETTTDADQAAFSRSCADGVFSKTEGSCKEEP